MSHFSALSGRRTVDHFPQRSDTLSISPLSITSVYHARLCFSEFHSHQRHDILQTLYNKSIFDGSTPRADTFNDCKPFHVRTRTTSSRLSQRRFVSLFSDGSHRDPNLFLESISKQVISALNFTFVHHLESHRTRWSQRNVWSSMIKLVENYKRRLVTREWAPWMNRDDCFRQEVWGKQEVPDRVTRQRVLTPPPNDQTSFTKSGSDDTCLLITRCCWNTCLTFFWPR